MTNHESAIQEIVKSLEAAKNLSFSNPCAETCDEVAFLDSLLASLSKPAASIPATAPTSLPNKPNRP